MKRWVRLTVAAASLALCVLTGALLLVCTEPLEQNGSYAYESALIAESFQTAVSVSLAFAAGTALMILFSLQTLRGAPDLKTVCGALMAFFWLMGRLRQASFAEYYFAAWPVDMVIVSRDLSLTLLLVFLSAHMTGKRGVLLWVLTAAQGLTAAVKLLLDLTGDVASAFTRLEPLVGLAGLAAAVVCGLWECRRGNRFYRWLCALTGAGLAAWAAVVAISALISGSVAARTWQQLTTGTFSYFLLWLGLLVTAAALCAAIAEAVRDEIARQTQARLLAQRAEMTRSSYEAMRSQHEQVMMLRHDMAKHLHLLRQMTREPKTAEYLDELIGSEEKIRPVVQCGNEILDIILNSKLTAAADAGIEVELLRMQAPPELPLTDAELCSMVVNLMDNAIEAAGAPGVGRRYIKLDLHIKNDFFAFICENAAAPGWVDRPSEPEHGLGLEIVRQVANRYGNLIKTEYGENFYQVTVVLPLRQPLK